MDTVPEDPELERLVGYQLKRVQTALRAAMDAALHPHGLTVPQYACLELLEQRPGLSNAELARGAFVTRQSMNVVLRSLQEAGLVERPARAASGRVLPARLTRAGHGRLATVRPEVLAIERRMLAGVPRDRAQALAADMSAMAEALSAPPTVPP